MKVSLISIPTGTVFQNNQIARADEEKIFKKIDEGQLVNVKGMMKLEKNTILLII